MSPATIFVLLCASLVVTTSNIPVTQIAQFRNEFLQLEQHIWTEIDNGIETNAIIMTTDQKPQISAGQLALVKAYRHFGDRLETEMPFDVTYGVTALDNSWIWARTYSELRGIYALYETFRRFQRLQTDAGRVPSPRQAWLDIAETILDDGNASVPEALHKVQQFVTDDQLFHEAYKAVLFSPCDVAQSPHQVLFHLYQTVALTQLKAYVMVQFALQLFNRTETGRESRQLFRRSTAETARAAHDVLESGVRTLWRCDPQVHVRDETYTELTRLLQAYVENEVDMNPSTSCLKNCAYYDYAKSTGCYMNGFCSRQQRCRGNILNCEFLDSDMWVCPADKYTGRRYEYIEYENGRVLGRKMACNRGTTKVDSWWRYLFWHCSYCLCLCDDDTDSDRYFNLREYATDVDNDYVVTGVRFIKVNRIIHLQIQEGKLVGFGRIDNTTLRWRPVDNYHLHAKNVDEGHDYHRLSWEKRDIDLDDVSVASPQHAVTGLRFRVLGTHLNLEVRVTPFNFSSGALAGPHSYWHSQDMAPVDRTRLSLQNPDVPTRSHLASLPDSSREQYVEFTHTDFDRDAGQTTVPFLDTQMVVPEIPVPLSGIGIYHKGQPNFGGFVAPKVITYDFSKHIDGNEQNANDQIHLVGIH